MQLRYVNMRLPIIAMFLSITAFTFIVPIDSTQAQSGMGNGIRPGGMRPEGMRPGGKGTTEDTEIIKNLED
jgi:hypothetical protein